MRTAPTAGFILNNETLMPIFDQFRTGAAMNAITGARRKPCAFDPTRTKGSGHSDQEKEGTTARWRAQELGLLASVISPLIHCGLAKALNHHSEIVVIGRVTFAGS